MIIIIFFTGFIHSFSCGLHFKSSLTEALLGDVKAFPISDITYESNISLGGLAVCPNHKQALTCIIKHELKLEML